MNKVFLVLALGLTSTLALPAGVTLAPVFGDHMVLQRGIEVPLWGRAAPGEKVTVKFQTQEKSAVTDLGGDWRIKLEALAAGGPEIMTVRGSNTLTVTDILVGEVWVGAGQSNMQIPTSSFIGNPNNPMVSTRADKNLEALVNAAPYPKVRFFAAAVNNKPVPAAEMKWEPATSETLKISSAQLSAMGVTLSKKLDVPVGLILAAIGGSPSSRWVTPQAVAEDAACQESLTKARATYFPEKEQAAYEVALKKYDADQAAWTQLSEEEKKGKKAPGKPNPPVPPGVGRWSVGDLHEEVLKPLIGYGIKGVFWDQGESGAFIRGIDQFTMMGALFSSWRKEWGQGEFPFVIVQKPSGGGCAFDENDPVNGWASDKFQPLPAAPSGNGTGREEMVRIASMYPKIFMVPTSDLGGGLHPMNKFAYGARAARVIQGAIYGLPGEWNGPTLAESRVEGSSIRLRFQHVGLGLVTRHAESLQGFAIAGADKKFVWAQAIVDGEAVVVTAPSVPSPLYVRYAWDGPIPWANFFNQDGFPALTFRTDRDK